MSPSRGSVVGEGPESELRVGIQQARPGRSSDSFSHLQHLPQSTLCTSQQSVQLGPPPDPSHTPPPLAA